MYLNKAVDEVWIETLREKLLTNDFRNKILFWCCMESSDGMAGK